MRVFLWAGLMMAGMVIWGWAWPEEIQAGVTCSASVSPQSVQANTETAFTFSVSNTGSESITWIQVSRPSSHFQMINYGVSGWTVGCTSDYCEIWDGSVAPGSTFGFSFGVRTGSEEASSADWWIGGSSGGGLSGCGGGPFGTAIVGVADTTPPDISDPVVSGVTSATATISWSSDKPAKSEVKYGLEYGNPTHEQADLNLKTTHSVTLTNLLANTTYYYEYRSVDGSGNSSGWWSFYSFTTAAGSQTSGPAPTQVPQQVITVVESVKETVTRKVTEERVVTIIERDVVAPTVNFEIPQEVVTEPEMIRGEARDNKGILRVEYSLDDGWNWLRVDEIDGMGTMVAKFSFTPPPLMDGTYLVRVRAYDTSNNVKTSPAQTLTIDRFPPMVGGLLMTLETVALKANRNGVYELMAGFNYTMFVTSIGGTTELVVGTLSADGEELEEVLAEFRQRERSGIWSGNIRFEKQGIYELWAYAKDGAGHEVWALVGRVRVGADGKIRHNQAEVEGATIGIYRMQATTGRYLVYDPDRFGGTNRLVSDANGGWGVLLPTGKYYVVVEAEGLGRYTSERFEITRPRVVSFDIQLEMWRGRQIGPFKLGWDWFKKGVAVEIDGKELEEIQVGEPAGEMPYIELVGTTGVEYTTAWRGQEVLVVIAAPWHPGFSELVAQLEVWERTRGIRVRVILPYVSWERARGIWDKGRYEVGMWVDEEGKAQEALAVQSWPWLVRVDGAGRIIQASSEMNEWAN